MQQFIHCAAGAAANDCFIACQTPPASHGVVTHVDVSGCHKMISDILWSQSYSLLRCEHVECEMQIRKLRLHNESDDETVYFGSSGTDESVNLSSDELLSLE